MHRSIALMAAAALVLVACGGGSGNDVAGIDRTGSPVIAAYGTVSAFGSVVVNGVRYDTSSATFAIDGDPGTQADLSVGDVVLVKGTLDAGGTTGVATSVSLDNNVVGPVSAVDAVANTLVVLGQLVRVSADTSFDGAIEPNGVTGLAIGDVVEVSGLVLGDESIDATRIARRPAEDTYEVTGVAVGNQVALRTFFLGALFVNYRAAVVSGVPGGIVSNGQRVRVKGTLVGSVLAASRVSLQSNVLGGASGERRDVEGAITRFASTTDFDVSGLAVTTNAGTAYEGGTAADLKLSLKVEAEGTLNAAGVLVAAKIEIRRSAATRIVASVDSVDAAAGSLVLLGVTVRVDALTRFEDQSSAELRPFALGNVNPGDCVEVRGTEAPTGSGQVLATLVERIKPRGKTELQGFVQEITLPLFTVLGVAVDASNAQLDGIGTLAELAVGDLVEIVGQKLGDRAIAASEVEVEGEGEDEDDEVDD